MKHLFLHREEIDVDKPHRRRPRGNLRQQQRGTKHRKQRKIPPQNDAFGSCALGRKPTPVRRDPLFRPPWHRESTWLLKC